MPDATTTSPQPETHAATDEAAPEHLPGATPITLGGTTSLITLPPARGNACFRSPQDVLRYAFERFDQDKLVMVTGFGMEGCAMIDMAAKLSRALRVLYVDTHFLFDETYELRDRLVERYPNVSFVRLATTLTADEQAEQIGPELWKANPDRCCEIRKVIPLRVALQGLDVWITGIRRSQSSTRAAARHIEWDEVNGLLKVNPLAFWERAEVWDYVQRHDVPHNALHHRGYPSIGCTHCTKRVEGATADSYSREGRWADANKTECGLHFLGENI